MLGDRSIEGIIGRKCSEKEGDLEDASISRGKERRNKSSPGAPWNIYLFVYLFNLSCAAELFARYP